jgi:hypothetical protein
MGVIWNDNFRINTPQGTPKCQYGPALAVLGDNLYMVYVGQGGQNLWSCHLPGGGNFAGWNNWQNNKQIEISSGNIPLSSFRPALAPFRNYLFMVYRGTGTTNLWLSWFDGSAWSGNVRLHYPGDSGPGSVLAQDGMPQPALSTFSDSTLVLVLREHIKGKDAGGNVVEGDYLFGFTGMLPGPSDPQDLRWNPPAPLGSGCILPAVIQYPTSPTGPFSTYAFFTDEASGEFRSSRFTGPWTSPAQLQGAAASARSIGGAALAVLNDLVYIIFPAADGTTLTYTTVDQNLIGSSPSPVQSASGVLKTSAPLGATTFNNSVCIAYKDANSDDIWFAHYP